MKTTLASAAGAIILALTSLVTHVMTEDRVKQGVTDALLEALDLGDCSRPVADDNTQHLREFARALPDGDRQKINTRLTEIKRSRVMVNPTVRPIDGRVAPRP